MNYNEFLKTKELKIEPSGFSVSISDLNKNLFNWQKELVRWSTRLGKSALFEGCGLGKTIQQLEFARLVSEETKHPVLILAPLAVSRQTKKEGEKFGIKVSITEGKIYPGVNITNYEKLHKIDTSKFSGIVLDESSILKSYSGKIRNQIINFFETTKYKLCCSATPAPNDYMELGNTCEFLNILSRLEMLSSFFIHDSGETSKWRLKGHTKKELFWKWLASWSVMIQKPSDIGFDDNGFVLPKLNIYKYILKTNKRKGKGFFLVGNDLGGIQERRKARWDSLSFRSDFIADMINKSNDIWIVWCNLNEEGKILNSLIKDSVEIAGHHSNEYKENNMLDFADNKIKCLITKPSIAGFGMNWQNCSNIAYMGLSDSWEQFYQSLRRSWRFGQKKEVNINVVIGDNEVSVLDNIMLKESKFTEMNNALSKYMGEFMKQNIFQSINSKIEYDANMKMILPKFMEV